MREFVSDEPRFSIAHYRIVSKLGDVLVHGVALKPGKLVLVPA